MKIEGKQFFFANRTFEIRSVFPWQTGRSHKYSHRLSPGRLRSSASYPGVLVGSRMRLRRPARGRVRICPDAGRFSSRSFAASAIVLEPLSRGGGRLDERDGRVGRSAERFFAPNAPPPPRLLTLRAVRRWHSCCRRAGPGLELRRALGRHSPSP